MPPFASQSSALHYSNFIRVIRVIRGQTVALLISVHWCAFVVKNREISRFKEIIQKSIDTLSGFQLKGAASPALAPSAAGETTTGKNKNREK